MIQFKSFNGLTSLVLGGGLIATNFMSLNLLARKDGGIPDIAKLANTPYSSIQIRSETKPDGAEEWMFNSKQHDPKTLLYSEDRNENLPGFLGKKKREVYIHKETVAHTDFKSALFQGGGSDTEELTAKKIECLEKKAMGKSNGEMVGTLGAAHVTPALASVPIIGPILSGIAFGQARKAAGNIGSDIASDFNDC